MGADDNDSTTITPPQFLFTPEFMEQLAKEFETKDEVGVVMTVTNPDGSSEQREIILKKATPELQAALEAGTPIPVEFRSTTYSKPKASATLTVTAPDGTVKEYT